MLVNENEFHVHFAHNNLTTSPTQTGMRLNPKLINEKRLNDGLDLRKWPHSLD